MARYGVQVRRVYEDVHDDDGIRVLVDRIWPRGVRKDAVQLDDWAQDVAPSTELRRWYGHDQEKFAEFRKRYRAELDSEPAGMAMQRLRDLAEQDRVTLLTASRDIEHSQAAVLRELLS